MDTQQQVTDAVRFANMALAEIGHPEVASIKYGSLVMAGGDPHLTTRAAMLALQQVAGPDFPTFCRPCSERALDYVRYGQPQPPPCSIVRDVLMGKTCGRST